MNKTSDTETRYRFLKFLETNSEIPQRELVTELGISLGKTNYHLKALIDRGWVKMTNFTRNDNKIAYFYKLTFLGIGEKAMEARKFLARKLEENERITAEMGTLRSKVLGTQEETLADEAR